MTRWTEADLARLQGRTSIAAIEPADRKYKNRPSEIDGIKFDSALEGRCYEELKLRQKAGDVLWFVRQVNFALEGGVVYRVDFLAAPAKGPPHIELIDATGMLTQVKINKLKQLKARYGLNVTLWKG